LLEDRVRALGATYEKADKLWAVRAYPAIVHDLSADAAADSQPKVVHSGNLLTGQNPASAKPLAEDLLKKLQAQD
jgi:putative intracellular protease/amidase